MSEEEKEETNEANEPKELTLREQLEADMKDYENKGEDDDESEEEDKSSGETDDDKGDETEDGVTKEQQEEDAGEDSEDEGEDEEELNLDAPDHWSDDDKKLFDGQNDETKTYLLGRTKSMEADYTKKTTELAEQRKTLDPLNAFVDKWTPHTDQVGVPLLHGLEKLMEADRGLRNGTAEQKQQLLLQLAQQYGINMNTTPVEQDEYTDPQLQKLQDQVTTLNGNLQARDQQDQKNVALKQQTAIGEAQTAVDAFKDLKDDKGNLKYPNFETLKTEILGLVQSGQTGTGDFNSQLETAYEKALWMNTETREQLLASKQSSLKEESIKKQSKAAAQAKKSAKANKKGTNAKAGKPEAPKSLRDDLKEQIELARAEA